MAGEHEFIGYVVHETGRALLFQDHFWTRPNWMPKSQMQIFSEPDTSEIRVVASSWICDKNGVKEFTEWTPPVREGTDGS